jgi:predicted RNase H-like nuclease (RuvC/YqgF family)
VPEISARDLRRLQALEERLTKTRDERQALAAERRELRAAVTANARRARAAEKEAAAADDKVEAILRENAALAARIDEIQADLERVQAASLELRAQVDATSTELGAAQQALAAAEGKLGGLEKERDSLSESLKLANEQLSGKGMTPVLPAKEVAKLVEGLVLEIGTGLPGMVVRDGELRLQVAFGKIGQQTGFVIPSAETPPDVRKNLHEVAIRFDRTVELP